MIWSPAERSLIYLQVSWSYSAPFYRSGTISFITWHIIPYTPTQHLSKLRFSKNHVEIFYHDSNVTFLEWSFSKFISGRKWSNFVRNSRNWPYLVKNSHIWLKIAIFRKIDIFGPKRPYIAKNGHGIWPIVHFLVENGHNFTVS